MTKREAHHQVAIHFGSIRTRVRYDLTAGRPYILEVKKPYMESYAIVGSSTKGWDDAVLDFFHRNHRHPTHA